MGVGKKLELVDINLDENNIEHNLSRGQQLLLAKLMLKYSDKVASCKRCTGDNDTSSRNLTLIKLKRNAIK